jgi:hypothetical protein
MEYVNGVGLDVILEKNGKLPVTKALAIFEQICAGLEYVHDCGILHRDLKPSNIMLIDASSDNPRVKLLDFGVAKFMDNSAAKALTQVGEVVGSPLYMSPEQAKGMIVDQRSDIYSLGCVLYEMLSGAPPFDGQNAVELILKQVGEKARPLNSVIRGEKLPNTLETLVAKMLEKDQTARYQTVQEIRREISKIRKAHRSWYHIDLPKFSAASKQSRMMLSVMAAVFVAAMLAAACAVTWSIATWKKEKDIKITYHEDLPVILTGMRRVTDTNHKVVSAGGKMDSGKAPDADLDGDPGDALLSTMHDKRQELEDAIRDDKEGIDLECSHHDPLSDKEFARLKNRVQRFVQQMKLNGQNHLTEKSIDVFADMPLSSLELNKTNLTGSALKKIAKFDTLTSLKIDRMKDVKPEDLMQLAKLRRLRAISLEHCKLTPACMKALASIKSLENVTISENPHIGTEGLSYLANLHLTKLDAYKCGIGDDAVPYIRKMKSLVSLNLAENNIGNDMVVALSDLDELRTADLSSNMRITDVGLEHCVPKRLLRAAFENCLRVSQSAIQVFMQNNKSCLVYMPNHLIVSPVAIAGVGAMPQRTAKDQEDQEDLKFAKSYAGTLGRD